MDYVMLFNGKYIPVEVKLAVSAEPNIIGQVSKYVHNSKVYLADDGSRYITWRDFHDGKVLIIDTEKLYMYDDLTRTVAEIYELDSIIGNSDIAEVRKVIIENL